MAKHCPITNEKVLYLECLECDNKVCEKTNNFNAKEVKNKIVKWIKEWFEQNGPNCNAVIGLSGGKDSNIVAALCVEALGKDRVIGITMPNTTQTDANVLNEDLKCVKTLVEHLGIRCFTIPITNAYNDTLIALREAIAEDRNVSEQTQINLAPRLRMTTLYALSQSYNGRVANTCNWSEEYVGYSTRFGDGGTGDFAPLLNLTVTEIKQVGYHCNLPKFLIDKIPADGLCGKTDEDNLGFTYSVLDKYIRTGICEDPLVKQLIDTKHTKNLFKLRPIPSFQL